MDNKKALFMRIFLSFLFIAFSCQCAYSWNNQSLSTSKFKTSSNYKSPSKPTPSYNRTRSYATPSRGSTPARPQKSLFRTISMQQPSEGRYERDGQGGFQRTSPPGRTAVGNRDTKWRGYKGAKVVEISKQEHESLKKQLTAQGVQLVALKGKPNEYMLYNTKTKKYVKGQYFRVHEGESTITHFDMPATKVNIIGLIGYVDSQLSQTAKAGGKEAVRLGTFESSEAFDEAGKNSPHKTNTKVGIMWGIVHEAPHAFRIVRWERFKNTDKGLRSQLYYRLKPLD